MVPGNCWSGEGHLGLVRLADTPGLHSGSGPLVPDQARGGRQRPALSRDGRGGLSPAGWDQPGWCGGAAARPIGLAGDVEDRRPVCPEKVQKSLAGLFRFFVIDRGIGFSEPCLCPGHPVAGIVSAAGDEKACPGLLAAPPNLLYPFPVFPPGPPAPPALHCFPSDSSWSGTCFSLPHPPVRSPASFAAIRAAASAPGCPPAIIFLSMRNFHRTKKGAARLHPGDAYASGAENFRGTGEKVSEKIQPGWSLAVVVIA